MGDVYVKKLCNFIQRVHTIMHVADVFFDDDYNEPEELTSDERTVLRNSDGRYPLANFCVKGEASPVVLRRLLKKHKPGIFSVQDAIIEAVKRGSAECITLLYNYASEHESLSSAWQQRFGIVTQLCKSNASAACRDAVWKGNAKLPEGDKLSFYSFAENYTSNGFYSALVDLFSTAASAADGDTYWEMLGASIHGTIDTPSLEKLMALHNRFPPANDKQVVDVVLASDNAAVTVLTALASSRDIASYVTPAVVAGLLVRDDITAVNLLAECGVDFSAHAEAALDNTPEDMPRGKVFAYLDSLCDGRFARALAQEERLQLKTRRFSIVDRDTLLEKKKIPNQGTLTVMFNFATRQQIITNQNDKCMAMTITNFSDLNDIEVLRLAADRFVALKGNPALVEGVTMRLKKATLPFGKPKE